MISVPYQHFTPTFNLDETSPQTHTGSSTASSSDKSSLMTTPFPNDLNHPIREVPWPPAEFGQDGGKFYKCYDAIADEIDDDMAKGLKEQLDGLLIFAGLFAGVNSAFLALTIPSLSPDTTDDTNALLAQNNALLSQLITGKNDTTSPNLTLPSQSFKPAGRIFTVNVLFSLSMSIALISSFLAVVGRQWLVYYRKRSGGGPDRQRWEQLKRYLGAQRWCLEAILDDVLPSLLQLGLIIFCVALIVYLYTISPAMSIIAAIPIYLGLIALLGSAFCSLWDRFCPYHSPLSHFLNFTLQYLTASFSTRGVRLPKRTEESPAYLQTVALQRAICTSDDVWTALHAVANAASIFDTEQVRLLWSDAAFRERFFHFWKTCELEMSRDQRALVPAMSRLFCITAVHTLLSVKVLNDNFDPTRLLSPIRYSGNDFGTFEELPPEAHLSLLKAHLLQDVLAGWPRFNFVTQIRQPAVFRRISKHLDSLPARCGELCSTVAWLVNQALEHSLDVILREEILDSLRNVYGGRDESHEVEVTAQAIQRLSKSELRLGQDGDRILTFLLHGIARKEWESVGGTETGLTRLTAMHAGMLLKGSEKELMSGILEAMRRLLPQRMRSGLDEQDLNLVKHFLEALRGTPKTRFSWIADGALARNPQDWRRCVDPGSSWWRSVPLSQAQNATMESLNAFLSDTENLIQAHESQTTLAQVRDPEIRWCYSRQEPWAMPKFRAWLSDDTESFETSDSDW